MTQSEKGSFNGLGPALRLLRHRHGLMQYQLAEKAGITKAMISSYEVGKHLPALETLSRMLRSLECDLHALQDAMVEMEASPIPLPARLRRPEEEDEEEE
ncbi:MAG TPA: helix-turn-helix transcriptional regulator [Thermoanaerobaculia bacterium]|nr:helix-turn-helix transcriptional regulator [Thermoanaerobaculia bacterium]